MVSNDNSTDRKYSVKISDFGMSRVLVSSDYYSNQSKELPYKWASVEVLKFNKYSIYSGIHKITKKFSLFSHFF